jgi:hypothetical protein
LSEIVTEMAPWNQARMVSDHKETSLSFTGIS